MVGSAQFGLRLTGLYLHYQFFIIQNEIQSLQPRSNLTIATATYYRPYLTALNSWLKDSEDDCLSRSFHGIFRILSNILI